jgi:hypothetical protein
MREAVVRSALGTEALVFLEGVVQLTAHPLGESSRQGDEKHELDAVERVLPLLEAALGDERSAASAAQALAADPELLGAFFQSLDLLPAGDYAPADSIALLVMMALAALDDIGDGADA